MKKIILAAFILACSFTSFAADEPNEKVLNAFQKTFQNAQEVSWNERPDSYEVKFKQESIMVKVTYDREGKILRTLRYYGGDRLPIMVISAINERFANQKVYGVVEVASEEGTYYHVTLETAKHWIEVKADNYGVLNIEKKFRKA